MHLLRQIPTAFAGLRQRDGVLLQDRFQRPGLTVVRFFVRRLSCGRGFSLYINVVFDVSAFRHDVFDGRSDAEKLIDRL